MNLMQIFHVDVLIELFFQREMRLDLSLTEPGVCLRLLLNHRVLYWTSESKMFWLQLRTLVGKPLRVPVRLGSEPMQAHKEDRCTDVQEPRPQLIGGANLR